MESGLALSLVTLLSGCLPRGSGCVTSAIQAGLAFPRSSGWLWIESVCAWCMCVSVDLCGNTGCWVYVSGVRTHLVGGIRLKPDLPSTELWLHKELSLKL